MREGPDDTGVYQRRAAKRFSDAVAPLLKVLTRDQVAAALGLRVRGKPYSRAQLRAWMRGGSAPLTVLEAAEDLRKLTLEEVIDLLQGVLPARDTFERRQQKISLSVVAGGLALYTWILCSIAASHSYDPRRWIETSWALLTGPGVHIQALWPWHGGTPPFVALAAGIDTGSQSPSRRVVPQPPSIKATHDSPPVTTDRRGASPATAATTTSSLPTAARGGGSIGGAGSTPSSSARSQTGTPVATQPAAGGQKGNGNGNANGQGQGNGKGQGNGNGKGQNASAQASVNNGAGNGNANGKKH